MQRDLDAASVRRILANASGIDLWLVTRRGAPRPHKAYATYIGRPSISIAWGMPDGVGSTPVDRRFDEARPVLADIYLDGVSIQQEKMLLVDQVAYLPHAQPAVVPGYEGLDIGFSSVTEWQILFARMINELSGNDDGEWDYYFDQYAEAIVCT